MKNPYEDIINLPNHRSSKHPQMPKQNRAAQFSPFAAFTGHEAAVREAGRITDKRVELDEYIKADLNERLSFLQKYLKDKPEVSIEYFEEDDLKDGGRYIRATGKLKKIDEYKKLVVMENGREIYIKDIFKIDCELFTSLVDSLANYVK